jgi:hypothetical protein
LWAAAGTVVAATVVGAFVATSVAPPSPAVALNSSRLPSPPPTDAKADAPPSQMFVVTGDSVSLTLAFGFDQDKYPDVRLVGEDTLGCNLFAGDRVLPDGTVEDGGPQCEPWRESRPQWLQSVAPTTVIVLSDVWETYDRLVEGKVLAFGTLAFDKWFLAGTEHVISQLASGGAHVVVLTSPCNRRDTGVNDTELPENSDARIDHLNELYRQAAATRPQEASVVDLHQYACPYGKYRNTVDGQQLRYDGVHFSKPGGVLAMDWVMNRIEALPAERTRTTSKR